MKVFLHGSDDKPPPAFHLMFISPAGDIPNKEVPTDWVDADNKPVAFEVTFKHGEAEVTDEIGRYLVARGIAFRSRLLVPTFFG